MKVNWEGRDIRCGRVVAVHDASDKSERFMIGYTATASGTVYHLISMRDGSVMHQETKPGLASELTRQNMVPIETFEWYKP